MRLCVAIGLLLSLVALSSCANAEGVRDTKRKRKSKFGAPSSGAFSELAVDLAGGQAYDQTIQASTTNSRRNANAVDVDSSSGTATASKLTDQAMELVRLGRHAAALTPFQQACLLEPDNAGRWVNLGSVLRDLGRSEDALAAYDRGLLMSPDDLLLKQQHLAMLQLLGKKTKDESPTSLSSSVEARFVRDATVRSTNEPPAPLHAAPSTDGASSVASTSTSASTRSLGKSGERQSRNYHARKILPPLKLPVKPAQAPPAEVSSLVHCATTKGDLDMVVHAGWAPHGTARFLELVKSGFFSSGKHGVPLYRAVAGFMVQFGASTDSNTTAHWRSQGPIPDDPQWLPRGAKRFRRGMVSFAGNGPNTRSTQLFVSFAGIGLGDAPHEVPFGTLVGEHSFQTLDAFYTGYGEIGAFGGKAPDPHRISASSTEEEEEESSGDEYLLNNYPQLDYIQSCALTWQSNWTSSNRDEHSSSSSRENSDYNSVVPSSTTPVATTKATTTPRALPDVAPSPSLPLPRYNPNLPWPPSMSNEREASFFWWLDPLKQAILKLQDEEKASGRLKEARREVASEGESPSSSSSSSPSLLDDDGQRQILRPGEVHSVENFLTLQERRALRSMVLRLKKQQGQGKVVHDQDKANEPDLVHRTTTNGAGNVAAFPPVWATSAATEEDRKLMVQTLAKVAVYANRRVVMEGTLQGDHKQDDSIGAHLGIFAMYDYQPDPLGKASEVVPHTDSDYQGRCLSAALHLDNWDSDDEAEVDAINNKGAGAPAPVPTGGGTFQTFACKSGAWLDQVSKSKGKRGQTEENCEGAVGDKLEALIEAGIFHPLNDTLQVQAEVPYEPGRLAMFLPETPHAVTPLTGPGSRAVLFMWFHCRQFTQPPGRYPGVQGAIERADVKFKAQKAAQRKTKRPRKR